MSEQRLKYDYSRLLGKMKQMNITQEKLAKALNISSVSVSYKLNNEVGFKQKEITKICYLLSISQEEVGEYFFTR